jgi:hypothetical protein
MTLPAQLPSLYKPKIVTAGSHCVIIASVPTMRRFQFWCSVTTANGTSCTKISGSDERRKFQVNPGIHNLSNWLSSRNYHIRTVPTMRRFCNCDATLPLKRKIPSKLGCSHKIADGGTYISPILEAFSVGSGTQSPYELYNLRVEGAKDDGTILTYIYYNQENIPILIVSSKISSIKV